MRKRLLTAAAVLSLTLGAAACGSSDGTDDTPTVTTVGSATTMADSTTSTT